MLRLVILLMSCVTLTLALGGAEASVAPDRPAVRSVADLLTVAAGYPAATECSFEYWCHGGHRLGGTGAPAGDWLSSHGCQGPPSHSGPSCSAGGEIETRLDLPTLRTMTLEDVRAHVGSREGSGLVVREEIGVVDLLACDGGSIVGRVPFAQLPISSSIGP